MRKKFTSKDVEYIKKHYVDKSTQDIALYLDRTIRSIYLKAWSLGLRKSKEYINSIGFQKGSKIGASYRFPKGHTPANKGKKMPDEIKDRIKHTFFPKEHEPHNTLYDGAISTRKDTKSGILYKYIRVSKGKWELLHRYIWEKNNGPIPKAHVVAFKDGNTLNTEIENLELLTYSENMIRNSIQRYPEELRIAMQTTGRLTKKIQDYGKE